MLSLKNNGKSSIIWVAAASLCIVAGVVFVADRMMGMGQPLSSALPITAESVTYRKYDSRLSDSNTSLITISSAGYHKLREQLSQATFEKAEGLFRSAEIPMRGNEIVIEHDNQIYTLELLYLEGDQTAIHTGSTVQMELKIGSQSYKYYVLPRPIDWDGIINQ